MTEISIELIVYGRELIPSELTLITGVQPTKEWNRGDSINVLGKEKGKHQSSLWMISTGYIETLDFEEVTSEFMLLLDRKAILKLKEVSQNEEIEISVLIAVNIYNKEIPSLFFKSKFLEVIALLGAELDVDLHLF